MDQNNNNSSLNKNFNPDLNQMLSFGNVFRRSFVNTKENSIISKLNNNLLLMADNESSQDSIILLDDEESQLGTTHFLEKTLKIADENEDKKINIVRTPFRKKKINLELIRDSKLLSAYLKANKRQIYDSRSISRELGIKRVKPIVDMLEAANLVIKIGKYRFEYNSFKAESLSAEIEQLEKRETEIDAMINSLKGSHFLSSINSSLSMSEFHYSYLTKDDFSTLLNRDENKLVILNNIPAESTIELAVAPSVSNSIRDIVGKLEDFCKINSNKIGLNVKIDSTIGSNKYKMIIKNKSGLDFLQAYFYREQQCQNGDDENNVRVRGLLSKIFKNV